MALAFLGVGSVAGCLGGSSAPATKQLDYDLTIETDRAQWKTEGLEYQGSVGPYAVYRVTADHQRLVGPRVIMPAGTSVATLQWAKNYFIASGGVASPATLTLRSGQVMLCQGTQPPAMDGQCTPPSDQTGSPTGQVDMGPPADVADMASGWGSGCNPGSGGSGGGGYGGGGGGYGGSGGGSYSNPGGYGGGGWKDNGCGDGGGAAAVVVVATAA